MPHLSEPLETARLHLKNRLVMAPMETTKAEDGRMTQGILDHYADRARGGALGLIITEHTYVSDEGARAVGQLSSAHDEDVEGLASLAKVVHDNDTMIIGQISHAGGSAFEGAGQESVAPSAIDRWKNVPRELGTDEIAGIVAAFSAAALRMQRAGFDGVEIHSAHGYLLDQFFSPITNKREDEYGGDIQGRIRIHLEIIHAVREACGDGFPILLRLGAADYDDEGEIDPNGAGLEDSKIAALAFQEAGIDLLDVSGGLSYYKRPNHREPGYFSELSAAMKEVLSIPVNLAGGVKTAADAEALLVAGVADTVAVGRALWKDPNWAREAMFGAESA